MDNMNTINNQGEDQMTLLIRKLFTFFSRVTIMVPGGKRNSLKIEMTRFLALNNYFI